LLAGRGGGTIKTGRYINHDEPTDLASIHVALMQRMGVPIERLGTAGSTYEELI
jgi:hypothetical protein